MAVDNYDEENQIIELQDEDTTQKYLTFFVDTQTFGAPISDVLQIIGMQKITPIPDSPNYAKGIINLRGEIIPIVDMQIMLNNKESVYDERTCIIISNISGQVVGFIVDSVDEVMDIPNEMISLPANIANNTKSYLTGVARAENKVVLLINLQKTLGNDFAWAEKASV